MISFFLQMWVFFRYYIDSVYLMQNNAKKTTKKSFLFTLEVEWEEVKIDEISMLILIIIFKNAF